MIVSVLGANSLLAQYLIRYIQRLHNSSWKIYIWSYSIPFHPRISGITIYPLKQFVGLERLYNAVKYADIVFNLHEAQDLTLLPDKKQLEVHNVNFVRSLLSCARCPLVHLSSIFLQCSSYWPNVYESENEAEKYTVQWPFPSYCLSKWEAEQIIANSSVDAYIIRCVPVYGEGDTHSILTDLIKYAKNGNITSLGDGEGVLQMAYAENIVVGLWSAVKKLLPYADPQSGTSKDIVNSPARKRHIIRETIILADETPKKNVITLFKPLLANGKRFVAPSRIPFLTFCYFYYMVLAILNLLSKVLYIPRFIRTESLNRCRMYYNRLVSEDIRTYSWNPYVS
ncbi:NAD dependent epimerase/dehydratase family protein [Dictyocaulus viviparus]|uniref:NAD dependent epimerase/dehydratase family protein n=1 Tax=Dictyocaulus viviparus TaxID=29172 RepID=A0A0D8Y8C6_DICVI|nr:NAD dependent epimerase/dehydratase family protein [Dictyocaulus viviparus]